MEDKILEFKKILTQQGLSDLTIYQYLSALERFQQFAVSHNSQDITTTISDFLHQFQPRTRLWYLILLKQYFHKCHGITFKYPNPKWHTRHPKWLTEKEVKTLLELARSNQEIRIVMLLLYAGGLRAREALVLKVKNIDPDGYITVLGKGGNEETVPIDNLVVKEVIQYIQTTGKVAEERLFSIDYSTLYAYIRGLGISAGFQITLSPHILRHSFASHLVQKGVNPYYIQKVLRHKNIASTQVYLHMLPKDLKDKLPKLLEDTEEETNGK